LYHHALRAQIDHWPTAITLLYHHAQTALDHWPTAVTLLYHPCPESSDRSLTHCRHSIVSPMPWELR